MKIEKYLKPPPRIEYDFEKINVKLIFHLNILGRHRWGWRRIDKISQA